MTVTGVETLAFTLPLDPPILSALGGIARFGCVLVRVETADGIVGENMVFTLNDRRTRVLRQMVDDLSDLIIGEDPGLIAQFGAAAWKDINFLGHKGITVMAISALDGALWDAAGKRAGLPIHRMIGGAHRRIPAYHSGGLWLSSTIDELVREAQDFLAAGFRAMKMRVGPGPVATSLERVGAVREAIGPDVSLMVDANQGLTEPEAIRLGRALEETGLAWLEEPLPAWDLHGLARVAAALDTPIASGETEYTRYGFRQMIELRAADVLMPDLQRVGGVSEFVRVGHMAEAWDIPVSSHLFPETSLQVLGGLNNAMTLEYMPWFSRLYTEQIAFEDGCAVVPDRPGWGFTFDMDQARRLAAD